MLHDCGLTKTQFWWYPCPQGNFFLSIDRGEIIVTIIILQLVLSYPFIVADFLPYCHT